VAARLKEQYNGTIRQELHDKYKYSNVMEVPKLEKVVVNMGCGDAAAEARLIEMAMTELGTIAGQKPSPREARKSVSNFKIREGQRIGCMVTLRGERMYEFIDRLFNIAMPRIRDFRGVSEKAFDNGNNYTLGLKEQTMFPEINMDKVQVPRGMNVTFVINGANTREEGYDLLLKLGMPFQDKNTAGTN
jgi:large subunit ribosomal protein L5